jgi:hypothetical protein
VRCSNYRWPYASKLQNTFYHSFGKNQTLQTKSALVIGATGLTGSLLLDLLLRSDAFHLVQVYCRKSLGITHPKLKEYVIDFDQYEGTIEADVLFCCLGTTIKKVKTQEAFKKVDLEYPVKYARLQQAVGTKRMMVISAMGASANSSFFYSRVKAQMETELAAIGFEQLSIFRPALITGNRLEHRSGEKIVSSIFGILNPLLLGGLRKYRSIPAARIAQSMLDHSLLEDEKGCTILLSDEI